jgi:tetratricopeptide (TPR) repeat protein
MTYCLLFTSLALLSGGAADCSVNPETIVGIRNERITGSLAVAESETRRLLACQDLEDNYRLELRIELTKILDRVGLHYNTRPVVESLEILRQAGATVDAGDNAGQAAIELAMAEYFYRAEMSEREFPSATEHGRRAQVLFRELDDPVGETDAVHRLGLIELQKANHQEARKLFDRSLELSREGPYRPIFLSDYHRHVGFIDRAEGDHEAAIQHFEMSLKYRNEAGSRDYGLFARTMLGTALIDDGRPAEARAYLEQALEIAYDLPSPVGELRATYALGNLHEALGEKNEALRRYRRADELATKLGVATVQRAARDGVLRLTATSPG